MSSLNRHFLSTVQILAIGSLLLLAGCGRSERGVLDGQVSPPPDDFRFLGRSSPCFLELPGASRSIRVNCFHIDGTLHIHSNRFAKLPRFRGESWVDTVKRDPSVRVGIENRIYAISATAIDDEERRQEILHERGYWYAWDGITIFSFSPR